MTFNSVEELLSASACRDPAISPPSQSARCPPGRSDCDRRRTAAEIQSKPSRATGSIKEKHLHQRMNPRPEEAKRL